MAGKAIVESFKMSPCRLVLLSNGSISLHVSVLALQD